EGCDGVGLVARWRGRPVGFTIVDPPAASFLGDGALEALAGRKFADAVLRAKVEEELSARWPAPKTRDPPALTVAVCTKDRPARLARLLASLESARRDPPFRFLEILVVDNAPSDDETGKVAAAAGVRHVVEPKVGLDFARTRALRAATGGLLAFLGDGVPVDPAWLGGLWKAWRRAPDAGGFTGLVLPMRLDTPAQLFFERSGGFGRGFEPTQFR